MSLLNAFFAVLCSLLALANLGIIFKHAYKYPMTLVVNGIAVVICIIAATFNFAQL